MSETHREDQRLGVEERHFHIIPVDVPDEHVILPISREHLATDEVAIYPLNEAGDKLEELSGILTDMLGHETTIEDAIETVEDAYTTAYLKMKECLEQDECSTLWVNVAGATDGAGIAFSQAATTLQIEYPERRTAINIYTVADDGEPEPVGSAPSGPPTDVGEMILKSLFNEQSPSSITELARRLSDGELGPSFRSKVQYNVKKLEQQGYVERKGDHRMRPLLTPTGRMWAHSHNYSPEQDKSYNESD